MQAIHRAVVALAAGSVALGLTATALADRAELTALMARCARLDRDAADLVRQIERSPDYDRAQDTLLLADLTVFRTYVRGLSEVAEQARDELGRRRPAFRDRGTQVALERLALRLRTAAAHIEAEMAAGYPTLTNDWNRLQRGDLDAVVAVALKRDTVIPPPPPPPPGDGRPPAGFDRVSRAETWRAPANLRGQARYIRIDVFGGDLTVKKVTYTTTEVAFGYLNFDYERSRVVNRDVSPGRPLLIEVDRGQMTQVSKIEIEWEPDPRRPCYARVTLTSEQ